MIKCSNYQLNCFFEKSKYNAKNKKYERLGLVIITVTESLFINTNKKNCLITFRMKTYQQLLTNKQNNVCCYTVKKCATFLQSYA